MDPFFRKFQSRPDGIRFFHNIAFFFLFFPTILPVFANESYREGKIAFSRRSYEEAITHFKNAIKENPDNGNAYFYIGYIYEKQDNKDLSIENYQHAVVLNMDTDLRDKAYWKIILYYKYIQDWENLYYYSDAFLKYTSSESVKKLKALSEEKLKNKDGRERILLQNALKKSENGDRKGAIKDLRELLSINSEFEAAKWHLGILYMSLNDYENGYEQFQDLIRLRPESWEYHYKAAICEYHLLRFESSLEKFEKAEKLNTDQSADFLHFIKLGRGLDYIELRKYDKAERELNEAIRNKKTAFALGALARCHYYMNRLNSSEKFAEEALKINASQRDALYTLAFIAEKNQKKKRAFSFFSRFVRTFDDDAAVSQPSYLDGFLMFAAIAVLSEHYDDAKRAFDRLDKKRVEQLLKEEKMMLPSIDPVHRSDRTYRIEDFFYYSGVFQYALKQYDQAISYFEDAKNRDDINFYLAATYLKRGDEKKARQYLKDGTGNGSAAQIDRWPELKGLLESEAKE